MAEDAAAAAAAEAVTEDSKEIDAGDVVVPPQEGQVWLVFGGKTGWIGQKLMAMLTAWGHTAHAATSRMEEREAVQKELRETAATHVICAAGVTGVPNVDYCETHEEETVRSNLLGVLTLVDVCHLAGVHMTLFATGCLYHYDDEHPIGGKLVREEDAPSFYTSWYSHSKMLVETVLRRCYPGVLTLRLRMPVSDDLHHRSLVTKLTRYEKVINIPNSISILHDLLPLAVLLAARGDTGIFNFTNPGAASHNQLLDLYIAYIDADFTYRNFTVEEQDRILLAPRSNTELDTAKLQAACAGIRIPHVLESLPALFKRMQAAMKKSGEEEADAAGKEVECEAEEGESEKEKETKEEAAE